MRVPAPDLHRILVVLLEPIWGVGAVRVAAGVEHVHRRLPVPLREWHTDNGSEFLNRGLLRYCRRHGIRVTRGRQYRKNDQAWVELRNWLAVRRLVGRDRDSSHVAFGLLKRLYALERVPQRRLHHWTRELHETRGQRVRWDRVWPSPSLGSRLLAAALYAFRPLHALRSLDAFDALRLLDSLHALGPLHTLQFFDALDAVHPFTPLGSVDPPRALGTLRVLDPLTPLDTFRLLWPFGALSSLDAFPLWTFMILRLVLARLTERSRRGDEQGKRSPEG